MTLSCSQTPKGRGTSILSLSRERNKADSVPTTLILRKGQSCKYIAYRLYRPYSHVYAHSCCGNVRCPRVLTLSEAPKSKNLSLQPLTLKGFSSTPLKAALSKNSSPPLTGRLLLSCLLQTLLPIPLWTSLFPLCFKYARPSIRSYRSGWWIIVSVSEIF